MEATMTQLAEPSRKSALPKLDDAGRAALFTEARTANSFADTPVTDSELADIWELAKWAPTSANLQPLRVCSSAARRGSAWSRT
jgi:3-hydroxypropanoate dehydrogenase